MIKTLALIRDNYPQNTKILAIKDLETNKFGVNMWLDTEKLISIGCTYNTEEEAVQLLVDICEALTKSKEQNL